MKKSLEMSLSALMACSIMYSQSRTAVANCPED
jgi:hypothetical protein